MGNLALLPRELLNEITKHITGYDIENYALICKRTFESAFPALQIHRSRKQFTETTLEIWPDPMHGVKNLARAWDSHPFWLLRALLDDPGLAFYIRHLKVVFYNHNGSRSRLSALVHRDTSTGIHLNAEDSKGGFTYRWEQQRRGIQDLLFPYQDCIGRLLIENRSYFYQMEDYPERVEPVPNSRRSWHYNVMKGCRENILGCILLLLRHTEKISFVNSRGILNELDQLLKKIGYNPIGYNTSLPPEERPLARLTKVYSGTTTDKPGIIESDPQSSDLSLRVLLMLARIPSVRTVKGDSVQYNTLYSTDLPSNRMCHTKIESIHLHHCDTSVGNTYRFFGLPCALKRFYFSSQPSGEGAWQPSGLVMWLRNYASKTLEELTLLHSPQNVTGSALYSQTFVGSLQPFERLKSATLMVPAFTQSCKPFDEGDCVMERGIRVKFITHRLVDMLPSSLERLVLCGEDPSSGGNVFINGRLTPAISENSILRGMKDSKQDHLPNLKEIVFEKDPHIRPYMVRQLKDDYGLEVTVQGNQGH